MNTMLTLAILIFSVKAAVYCDTNLDGHFKYNSSSECNTGKSIFANSELVITNYSSIILDQVNYPVIIGNETKTTNLENITIIKESRYSQVQGMSHFQNISLVI